jgi:hypothetical protein
MKRISVLFILETIFFHPGAESQSSHWKIAKTLEHSDLDDTRPRPVALLD